MKKRFTFLVVAILGLSSVLTAQTALDPGQFVNAQITEAGVYTVEAGQFYAFDGRIDLTFEVTIQGPDEGWIMEVANPAVLVGTPSATGAARDFFEIKEGGGLTLKNLMLSGTNSNDENGRVFITNSGGSKLIVDNCVITDWEDFALRNKYVGGTLSVTNTVFINGMRKSFSKWGGFPVRLDVGADVVIFENNTVINSGRLLANSGPFNNSIVTQLHNTYVNSSVIAEEFRAKEYFIANNIYYNYHFLGFKNENAASPDDVYASYFTGLNSFADSKENLDNISLYFGQNVIVREKAINDWFIGKDSISASLLWEHADVDSFIIEDDNWTIGANYNIAPEFATPPGNTAKIIDNIQASYYAPTGEWVDWRITSPVSFSDEGIPSLNWPPTFDMSYSNADLQVAGTDGLPVGDLNWFPAKKNEYLTNRDDIIESLRDSMENAVTIYDPLTMDNTPILTEVITSIDQVSTASGQFDVSNYPNPFKQSTAIKLRLPQQSTVTLTVFNMLGMKVIEMAGNELPTGTHLINLDASKLISGTYLYRINATGRDGQKYVNIKKMVKE